MVATTFFARAAVLLAAASQVSALGNAIVHNQCPFDVYVWSITDTDSAMQTLSAKGGQYTEAYRVNPNGGGVSIKMGSNTARTNITQFEYTLTGDSLWYDLSNIDGYPFAKYGVTVVSSDSGCRGVTCPAGTNLCAAAYNVPSDNFATAECGAAADAVIVLCSQDTDTDGSASVSSVASAAASTAEPTTIVATATAAKSTTHAQAKSTSHAQAKPSSTHQNAAPSHHSVVVQEVISTTAKPAEVTEAAANPWVVVQTTFVTHVVTVQGRSAQPTAAAEAKRDVHHEHAAVHQEHHARRHQHARAFGVSA